MTNSGVLTRFNAPVISPPRPKRNLVYPAWAVLIGIVMGPVAVIRISDRTPIVLWADLIILCMAIYAAVRVTPHYRKVAHPLPWVLWWYLAYFIVATAYLWLARDWLLCLAIWKLRMMPPLALFIAYSSVRDTDSARRIGSALGLTGGVVAALTIANWVIISRGGAGAFNSPIVMSKDMAQTAFGTSNYLATIMIFCLPWCMVPCLKSKLWSYLLSFGSMGTILWALLLTQSRGALICIPIGVTLFSLELVIAHRTRLRTLVFVFLAIAFTAVTAYGIWSVAPFLVESDLVKRVDFLVTDLASGNWSSNRSEAWLPAIEYITAHPVIGLGLGNQGLSGDLLGSMTTAHNVLLEAWLELGSFGFLSLVVFLYGGWRAWRLLAFGRDRTRVRLGLAGVLSFELSILHCMVEPSFWGPQFAYLFWIALGTGLALLRLKIETGPRSGSGVQTWLICR